jgi:hypothetical protein
MLLLQNHLNGYIIAEAEEIKRDTSCISYHGIKLLMVLNNRKRVKYDKQPL